MLVLLIKKSKEKNTDYNTDNLNHMIPVIKTQKH